MAHLRGSPLFATFLAVVSATGCGGPMTTPGTDAGPGVDAFVPGTDGGGGGMDMVDIRVVTGPEATPLAGALVAFDRPGGLRLETSTGADGIAHFDVDWANGPFDAVVWAAGYSARAVLDLDRATYDDLGVEGAFPVYLDSLAPETTVTVTGALAGAVDASHYLFVYNTANDDTWSGRGGPYDLEIPSGAPFRVIALEVDYVAGTDRDFTQAVVSSIRTAEQPGSATDVTLDLDLTMDTITMTTVTGSFDLPSTLGAFVDTANALATAIPTEAPTYLMGLVTSAAYAADGSSLDYEMAYSLPPGVTQVRSAYGLGNGDRRTLAFVEGVPVTGAQTFVLLPVPEVRELMPGSFPHVFETVVITNPVAEARPSVAITSATDRRYTIDAPPGEDHIVIPMLPTGADVATLFAGSLGRQISFCVLSETVMPPICERYSTSYRTPVDP